MRRDFSSLSPHGKAFLARRPSLPCLFIERKYLMKKKNNNERMNNIRRNEENDESAKEQKQYAYVKKDPANKPVNRRSKTHRTTKRNRNYTHPQKNEDRAEEHHRYNNNSKRTFAFTATRKIIYATSRISLDAPFS